MMATSDPAAILLAHDLWASRQIIDACSKLPDEQFHRRFEMGPGSLHDTVTHIIAAMRVWGDLLAGREERPRLEGTRRTIEELRGLLEETAADFAANCRANKFDEIVSRMRGGKMYHFTRGAVMTHVATHAMHHRAQCLNMLRQAGAKPLPPSSVTEWTWMADGV